jgi:hypothetical protein
VFVEEKQQQFSSKIASEKKSQMVNEMLIAIGEESDVEKRAEMTSGVKRANTSINKIEKQTHRM